MLYRCPSCGRQGEWAFCSYCATPTLEIAPPPVGSKHQSVREHDHEPKPVPELSAGVRARLRYIAICQRGVLLSILGGIGVVALTCGMSYSSSQTFDEVLSSSIVIPILAVILQIIWGIFAFLLARKVYSAALAVVLC